MSTNKKNEDVGKIQNSTEPRRTKRDRKKRTLHNIDNPQDDGESEGLQARRRGGSPRRRRRGRRKGRGELQINCL